MKKTILVLFSAIALVGIFFAFDDKGAQKQYVVGVILPVEHEALRQITQGIKDELEQQMGKSVLLKVKNAQGDANMQRAIIEQLVREGCNLLIPVGTASSQMTLNLAPKQKVLCLAADSALLQTSQQFEATALSDELSASDSLAFLHVAFPEMKKISLIYSASEKVAKEIPLVCEAALGCNIEVQKLMVQNMGELYTISRAIASDSEAIFILKDHLIVSGIQTIAKEAAIRQIPIMTSDEGSVIGGAAFAIGVKEESIGRKGAVIAKSILEGISPSEIAPQTMTGPFPLFINRTACERQGIDCSKLQEKAETLNYTIYFVGS